MLIILIRTVLIYLLLLSAMRLMGKRQIGELEVTDLVITLLLSDIATLPITDPDIPLTYAVIPIVALLATEVSLSFLLSRFPRLKNLGSARPNVLIRDGVPDRRELDKLRISAEELISELRQKNITEIGQVAYAILEQNGKISVIPRPADRQPTLGDLKLDVPDEGICHILISHGSINRYSMRLLALDDGWLDRLLAAHRCRARQVYLMTVTDSGKVAIWLKNGAQFIENTNMPQGRSHSDDVKKAATSDTASGAGQKKKGTKGGTRS